MAVDVAAQQTSNAIQEELDRIAVSLGLPAASSTDAIKTAVEAKLTTHLDGWLTLDFQPVKCVVSAADTVAATTSCDDSLNPLTASARCEGSCEAEVNGDGSVDCTAGATVECKSPVTGLECQGLCTGTCELDTLKSCAGTCQGTCDGSCAVEEMDGSCNGPCEGECDGACILEAADFCNGACTGECTYIPSNDSCGVGGSAFCAADGAPGASVECSGSCEGRVEPPASTAECEVSAKAGAEIDALCAPPALNVTFQFATDVDAISRAEFINWLEGFKISYSALLAANAQADILANVASDLAVAAGGSVRDSIQSANASDVGTAMGLACALDELPKVVQLTRDLSSRLSESIDASLDIVRVIT